MKDITHKYGLVLTLGFLLAVFAVGGARSALGFEIKNEGKDVLNVNGQLQMLGVAELLDNHGWKDDLRVYLFLKQARLNFNGVHDDCDYALQLMFGGEELPKANSVMSLLDAYVNVPLSKDLFEVKVGQFKVPYGRERLFDSGALFNTERSIQNNFFNIGRDVGLAVHSHGDLFAGAVGVFTGGGMDVPQRYLPEDLGIPLVVGRVGVNDGLDKDVFTPYRSDSKKGGIKYAAYLNGAYTEDSRVGHSTPLNVKYADKSLMINPNWNPYINAPNQKAEFTQFGADAAVQIPMAEDLDLLLSVEVNQAKFDNDVGDLEASGGVLGVNFLLKDWELGVRYAMVEPDSKFAYKKAAVPATATAPAIPEKLYPITDNTITEITPSIAYYARSLGVKIVADLAIQLDVPLSIEKDHGLYNLMLQPDSSSTIANGGVELQDVYVGRLVAQYNF